MEDYLKILSSIFISALTCFLVVGLLAFLYGLILSGSPSFGMLGGIGFVVGIGIFLYGFIGAFIWFLISKLLMIKPYFNKLKVHIFSAILSTLIITSVQNLVFLGYKDINKFISGYTMLLAILPIVICSVFVFNSLYLKSKT